MDEIICAAIDEIALEGPNGCTIPVLWDLLEGSLPCALVTTLTDKLKSYIWTCLLDKHTDMLPFLINNDPAYRAEEEEGSSRKKPRVKKPDIKNPEPQQKIMLHHELPLVRDLKQALEADVRIMASEQVRYTVLDIADSFESRYPLSSTQISVLEDVATSRSRGSIQSEVCIRHHMANRNFFYITKCLVERGLICKTPVMVRVPDSTKGAVVGTNLLHLPRFAPNIRLATNQVFKVVDTNGAGVAPGDGADVATYAVHNEPRLLKTICQRLSALPDKVALEGELKVVLGFRYTKGHREWRRLRHKLEVGGYIQIFLAKVKSKGSAQSCVRLLKDYVIGGPQEGDGDEGDGDQDDGGEANTAMIVEVSLERQMLEAIAKAGSAGILNVQVFEALGVNPKKSAPLLLEVVKKYQIQVQVVNVGKTIFNRLVAPPEVILRYNIASEHAVPCLEGRPTGRAHAPFGEEAGPSNALTLALVPADGPTAATPLDYGAAGPSARKNTRFRQPEGPSSQKDQSGKRLQPERYFRAESRIVSSIAPDPVELPVGPKDGGANRIFSILQKPGGADNVLATLRSARLRPGEGAADYEDDGGYAERPHFFRGLTEQADDRLRRLIARLVEHRFVLHMEIRSFLHNHESETGVAPPSSKGPDRKTTRRLCSRLIEAGKARNVVITLPASMTTGEARTIEVLVHPDEDVNDGETIQEIVKMAKRFERDIRTSGSARYMGELKLAKNETIDIMSHIAKLIPEGCLRRKPRGTYQTSSTKAAAEQLLELHNGGVDVEADPEFGGVLPSSWTPAGITAAGKAANLYKNGLLQAKMIRVRMLHYMLCKLVGLGGNDRIIQREPAAAFAAAPAGPSVAATPSSFPGPPFFPPLTGRREAMTFEFHSRITATASKLEGDDQCQMLPFSFSVNQLWDALPLSTAIQIFSTSNKVENLIELCQGEPLLGEMSAEQQNVLFDHMARKRLSHLLFLMARMGLLQHTIKATMCGGPRPYMGEQQAYMTVSSQATLDEPVGLLPDSSLVPGAAGTTIDSKGCTQNNAADGGYENVTSRGAIVIANEGEAATTNDTNQSATVIFNEEEDAAVGAATAAEDGDGDAAEVADMAEDEGELLTVYPDQTLRKARGPRRRSTVKPWKRPYVKKVKLTKPAKPLLPVKAELVRRCYELSSSEGLNRYWSRLEYVFSSESVHTQVLQKCFPATEAPEIWSRAGWAKQEIFPFLTMLTLNKAMDEAPMLDEENLDRIAEELNLNLKQVTKVAAARCERIKERRGAAQRVGSLSMAPHGLGRGPGRPRNTAIVKRPWEGQAQANLGSWPEDQGVLVSASPAKPIIAKEVRCLLPNSLPNPNAEEARMRRKARRFKRASKKSGDDNTGSSDGEHRSRSGIWGHRNSTGHNSNRGVWGERRSFAPLNKKRPEQLFWTKEEDLELLRTWILYSLRFPYGVEPPKSGTVCKDPGQSAATAALAEPVGAAEDMDVTLTTTATAEVAKAADATAATGTAATAAMETAETAAVTAATAATAATVATAATAATAEAATGAKASVDGMDIDPLSAPAVAAAAAAASLSAIATRTAAAVNGMDVDPFSAPAAAAAAAAVAASTKTAEGETAAAAAFDGIDVDPLSGTAATEAVAASTAAAAVDGVDGDPLSASTAGAVIPPEMKALGADFGRGMYARIMRWLKPCGADGSLPRPLMKCQRRMVTFYTTHNAKYMKVMAALQVACEALVEVIPPPVIPAAPGPASTTVLPNRSGAINEKEAQEELDQAPLPQPTKDGVVGTPLLLTAQGGGVAEASLAPPVLEYMDGALLPGAPLPLPEQEWVEEPKLPLPAHQVDEEMAILAEQNPEMVANIRAIEDPANHLDELADVVMQFAEELTTCPLYKRPDGPKRKREGPKALTITGPRPGHGARKGMGPAGQRMLQTSLDLSEPNMRGYKRSKGSRRAAPSETDGDLSDHSYLFASKLAKISAIDAATAVQQDAMLYAGKVPRQGKGTWTVTTTGPTGRHAVAKLTCPPVVPESGPSGGARGALGRFLAGAGGNRRALGPLVSELSPVVVAAVEMVRSLQLLSSFPGELSAAAAAAAVSKRFQGDVVKLAFVYLRNAGWVNPSKCPNPLQLSNQFHKHLSSVYPDHMLEQAGFCIPALLSQMAEAQKGGLGRRALQIGPIPGTAAAVTPGSSGSTMLPGGQAAVQCQPGMDEVGGRDAMEVDGAQQVAEPDVHAACSMLGTQPGDRSVDAEKTGGTELEAMQTGRASLQRLVFFDAGRCCLSVDGSGEVPSALVAATLTLMALGRCHLEPLPLLQLPGIDDGFKAGGTLMVSAPDCEELRSANRGSKGPSLPSLSDAAGPLLTASVCVALKSAGADTLLPLAVASQPPPGARTGLPVPQLGSRASPLPSVLSKRPSGSAAPGTVLGFRSTSETKPTGAGSPSVGMWSSLMDISASSLLDVVLERRSVVGDAGAHVGVPLADPAPDPMDLSWLCSLAPGQLSASDVAVDDVARREAERLCFESQPSDSLGTQPVDSLALARRALTLIREMGERGQTLGQLAAALAGRSQEEAGQCNNEVQMKHAPADAATGQLEVQEDVGQEQLQSVAGLEAAGTAAAAVTAATAVSASAEELELATLALVPLLRHSLVRAVNGFSEVHFMAAEASQQLVLRQRTREACNEGQQRTQVQQPPIAPPLSPLAVGPHRSEVMVRPWLDHEGRLNAFMLRPLARRVLGFVERHPGVREDVLLGHVDAICPANARELLSVLVRCQNLSVDRRVMAPKGRGRPSFLGGGAPLPQSTECGGIMRHYFPVLGASMEVMGSLAVL